MTLRLKNLKEILKVLVLLSQCTAYAVNYPLFLFTLSVITFFIFLLGGLAQLGRAPALQAGCQEFDPPNLQI
jgi:hypothetical protein